MELELRDKYGTFIFSVYGNFSNFMLNYLVEEHELTIENTKFTNGTTYRTFTNKTNKDIAGKNDFMTFFIKPGQYFKLLK